MSLSTTSAHLQNTPRGEDSPGQFASQKSYCVSFRVYFLFISSESDLIFFLVRDLLQKHRNVGMRDVRTALVQHPTRSTNSAYASLGNLQGRRSRSPPRHPLPAARPRQDEWQPAPPSGRGQPAPLPAEAESRAVMEACRSVGLLWRLCNLLMAAFFGLAAAVQVRAAGAMLSQAAAELGPTAVPRPGAAPGPRTPLPSVFRPPSPARPVRRLQGLRVRFLAAGERPRRRAVGGEYGLELCGAEGGGPRARVAAERSGPAVPGPCAPGAAHRQPSATACARSTISRKLKNTRAFLSTAVVLRSTPGAA